jgi:hypothetical protein
MPGNPGHPLEPRGYDRVLLDVGGNRGRIAHQGVNRGGRKFAAESFQHPLTAAHAGEPVVSQDDARVVHGIKDNVSDNKVRETSNIQRSNKFGKRSPSAADRQSAIRNPKFFSVYPQPSIPRLWRVRLWRKNQKMSSFAFLDNPKSEIQNQKSKIPRLWRVRLWRKNRQSAISNPQSAILQASACQ